MTNENTYLINPEDELELARLLRQGRPVTKSVGLLPPGINLAHLPSQAPDDRHPPRVLDIGCGPGEWVMELAAHYPEVEVRGIDISHLMVAYAQAEAANRETPNATFEVMNALEPMSFDDDTFDIVHIRTALAFVPRGLWPALYLECQRLLREEGILIHTEASGSITNDGNPASARLMLWLGRAMDLRGLGFWDEASMLHDIHAKQLEFFQSTGFQNIQQFQVIDDSSYGTPEYYAWLEHLKHTMLGIKPLVCGSLGISDADFHTLIAEAQRERMLDTFVMRTPYLTVCGRKKTAKAERNSA